MAAVEPEDRPLVLDDGDHDLAERLCVALREESSSWDGVSPLAGCDYPLHMAVFFNWIAVLECMIQVCTKATIRAALQKKALRPNQETPLHVACDRGHLRMVQLLVQAAERAGADQKKLLTQLNGKGHSPLRKAVQGGHTQIVLYLLEKHALSTPENVLLHMIAPQYQHSTQRGLVQVLLRHKTNVNTRDAKFNTVLHIAVQKGHRELLSMLLSQGVAVNLEAKNLAGDTPLLSLWRSSQVVPANSEEEDDVLAMTHDLVQAGANLQCTDLTPGTTLWHMAATTRRLAFLQSHHPQPESFHTATDVSGRTALNFRAFLNLPLPAYLEHGPGQSSLDIPDQEELLPLHWTCFHRNTESLQQLLLAAPPQHAQATFGPFHRTALHLLAIADWTTVVVEQDKDAQECVKILQSHGLATMDIPEDSSSQWSPLHHAAFRGIPWTTLRAFLECGASVSQIDAQGRTSLHLVGGQFKYHHNADVHGIVDVWLSQPKFTSTNVSKQRLLHNLGYNHVVLVAHPDPVTTLQVAQTLLEYHADAACLDHWGNLPFFLAANLEQVDATFVMVREAAQQGLFKGTMFVQSC